MPRPIASDRPPFLWEFQLGELVRLAANDRDGVVVGQQRNSVAHKQYQVRHLDGHGDQVERWYTASALTSPGGRGW